MIDDETIVLADNPPLLTGLTGWSIRKRVLADSAEGGSDTVTVGIIGVVELMDRLLRLEVARGVSMDSFAYMLEEPDGVDGKGREKLKAGLIALRIPDSMMLGICWIGRPGRSED